MKINNLKKGMVIKNYKELCKVLGEREKAGNSKKAQLEELARHINYKKDGHKFEITEIYITPMPKDDGRALSANNGAYGKYIRLLILNMLSQREDGADSSQGNILMIGKTAILQELNMINHNYKNSNYNRDAMAHYLGVEVKQVHEFFDTNTKKLRQTVETTLNRLMRTEKLIFWNTTKLINIKGVHREATNDEIKFIVNCEKQTLIDMGFQDINGIYATNRVKEYYKRINTKLREKDILYTYNAYKIIFADSVYNKNEQLDYKLGVEDLDYNKSELNSTICDRLQDSAETRHKKVHDEIYSGVFGQTNQMRIDGLSKYKKIVLEDGYTANNKLLVDVCIDDTYDNICEQVATAWREFKKSEDMEDEVENWQDVIKHWDAELYVGE